MRNNVTRIVMPAALVAGLLLAGATARAQRRAAQDTKTRRSKGDYAAYKLLKRGQELLEAAEEDRGVKMLQTIIEQHPRSHIRFQVYLTLGKHYLEAREHAQAIDYLRNLRRLERGNEKLTGKDRDMYLEGLYLTGVSHYQMRQYSAAFSVLRRITNNYSDTLWANQAYYYIGMSHFAQSHWNKAIGALNQVGAFIDPDSPTLAYAEAGHRFYVKIIDGDLPVLERLGRKVTAIVQAASGDKETITCLPGAGRKDVFVGSVPTRVGPAKVGDGTLQVIGGDKITVRYLDDNTKEGKKDIPRVKTVEVVSTGGITFTLGTYESLAPAAYLGQPLFLRLWDLDLDKTGDRDTATIRLVSLYKPDDEAEPDQAAPAMTVDVDKLLAEDKDEERLIVRDEVTLKLSEVGKLPVRKGIFLGSVPVKRLAEGARISKTDAILTADIGDEIVATYVDECHIGGKSPVEVTAKLMVAGEIDSAPRAAQDVVPDALIKARKQLVEAEAFLELARIFKSMGLMEGARGKAAEGLDRVQDVIRVRSGVPARLKEQAFQLKWNLHLAEDQFSRAMGTCRTFNRLYPESPLVDHALMGIGQALLKKKDYEGATKVFRQVVRMPNSHAKARAQFMIAEAIERTADKAEKAIQEYMTCAKRYPHSEHAGPALEKVVNYHIKTGALTEADDLLEQIFVDYRDEDFLDGMLLKWVKVSYDAGNYAKALAKCNQLISEYPGNPNAAKAEAILPKIKAMLEKDKKNEK